MREKEEINLNLQTRLNTENQQLEEKIRQEENLYQKLRAVEEQISQSQAQVREKESEKANLLKERDRQSGNLRAMQLERKEQRLVESELGEKAKGDETLREQLKEMVRRLREEITEKDARQEVLCDQKRTRC